METPMIGEKAVLVTIAASSAEVEECARSLDELERLLDTAGGEAVARVIQTRAAFDPRTCIGSGKVQEIHQLCQAQGLGLVVFDLELSPSQIRNLEDDIGDVRVIDRSMLILDIFALHAVSSEGKLQVELAQLKYTAPRLSGKGLSLSRQGGTIGTRGPGESQLESDRRHIKRRMDALEAQLREMESNRATMRAARDRSGIPKVAIVGYTNAGKSTLLNYLTGAGVLSQDKLFATLDPTTRRLTLPEGEEVLLTDTVGFIRKLPHHLVKAFHSTLEEAAYADILLIIMDATDSEGEAHRAVTEQLLSELGAGDKPMLYVYNKCDLLPAFPPSAPEEGKICLSASSGQGVEELLQALLLRVRAGKRRVTLCFPYSEQARVSAVYTAGTVEDVTYEADHIRVCAVLDRKGMGQFATYLAQEKTEE